LDPAPAITGTRPSARSTAMRTTRSRSASVSVAASPVEPIGTMPSMPSAICHSTKSPRAASSTAPSVVKGVMIAVMAPRSGAVIV